MTSQENRDAVLNWLNEVREQYQIGPRLDELPPPAKPGESLCVNCPVAKALETLCGQWTVTLGNAHIRFPVIVTEFIKDHDESVGF